MSSPGSVKSDTAASAAAAPVSASGESCGARLCGPKAEPDLAWGWAFHAWARGPWAINLSAFLGAYLTYAAQFEMNEAGRIGFFGFKILPTTYFSVLATIEALLSAVIQPLLGSLADFSPYRRDMLQSVNYMGAFATAAIVCCAIPHVGWWIGGIFFILSGLSYDATITFLYPYLPEIAPAGQEDKRSQISTKSVVWGNSSQVLLALLLSGLLALTEMNFNVRNGSFEDTALLSADWQSTPFTQLSYSGCGAPNPVCYSERGRAVIGSQFLVVDTRALSSGVIISQNTSVSTRAYRNRRVLFTAAVRCVTPHSDGGGDGDGGSYSLRLFDGVKWSESHTVSFSSTTRWDYSAHVFLPMAPTADELRAEFLFANGTVYAIDDVNFTPSANFMRPLTMLITGVWWAAFSVCSFRNITPRPSSHELPAGKNYVTAGLSQLWSTLREARRHRNVFLFLISFMLYCTGAAAIIALVGPFLSQQLRMSSALVGLALLTAQVIGIAGAILFYRIGAVIGVKRGFIISIVLWIITPILTFVLLTDSSQQLWIFLIDIPAGIAIGAGVALSRTMYAGMIPRGQEAEFMGLFGFFSKCAIWSGTLLFAVVNEATNNMRLAFLTIGGFFVAALIILLFVEYEPEKHIATAATTAAATGSGDRHRDSTELAIAVAVLAPASDRADSKTDSKSESSITDSDVSSKAKSYPALTLHERRTVAPIKIGTPPLRPHNPSGGGGSGGAASGPVPSESPNSFSRLITHSNRSSPVVAPTRLQYQHSIPVVPAFDISTDSNAAASAGGHTPTPQSRSVRVSFTPISGGGGGGGGGGDSAPPSPALLPLISLLNSGAGGTSSAPNSNTQSRSSRAARANSIAEEPIALGAAASAATASSVTDDSDALDPTTPTQRVTPLVAYIRRSTLGAVATPPLGTEATPRIVTTASP